MVHFVNRVHITPCPCWRFRLPLKPIPLHLASPSVPRSAPVSIQAGGGELIRLLDWLMQKKQKFEGERTRRK
jgi:hypothetical protein